MQILIPGLRAIRYTGKNPRKLWEVGEGEAPSLIEGSVVVVPIVTAHLLTRKDFEYFGGNSPIIEVAETFSEQVSEKGKGIGQAIKDLANKL